MNLTVDRFDLRLFRVPPRRRMEDSTHVVTAVELILLQLGSGDMTGTSLSYTAGVGGTATAALLRDYCQGTVLGIDAADPETAWDRMAGQLYRTGFGAVTTLAQAAIDLALWDLRAQALGQPLWQLAGAEAPGIETYASVIDLHSSSDALAGELRRHRDAGYTWFKIKVGRPDAVDDLTAVRAARDAIGPDAKLSLDANMGLTLEEAIRRGRDWSDLEIAWLEEPLVAEDVAGHKTLRQAIPIPVAVGESLYTLGEVASYIKADAVDIVQADIARIGGITPWLRCAAMAHEAGKPMAPHYMMEWAAHLLPAIPNGLVLENVLGAALADLGMARPGLLIENGRALPPEGPGLGMTFHPDDLTRYEVPLGDPLVTGARGRK